MQAAVDVRLAASSVAVDVFHIAGSPQVVDNEEAVVREGVRRTKIVATVGPATGSVEQLGLLLDAGVNVLRLNASHGTSEVRGEWIATARRLAEKKGIPLALLVDLQGPRIRVGDLAAPRELEDGADVVFAPEDDARGNEIPTTYTGLADDARPGTTILLDDGLHMNADGYKIWNEIVETRSTASLSRFILISYADLKKFKYFYWFAYPAFASKPAWEISAAGWQPAVGEYTSDQVRILARYTFLNTEI